MNKTQSFNNTNQTYQWFIFDAESQPLGRLSSEIAKVLLGKNSIKYTPGQSLGQGVIVINAKKTIVTGKKETDKFYYRHSGTPGGLTVETLHELRNRKPSRIIEQSVKRMLPKNSLGRELLRKLKIYDSSNHPHLAQNPIAIVN